MRSTLTTISVAVALLGVGAGTAAPARTRPADGRRRQSRGHHALAQGVHYQQLHSEQATVPSAGGGARRRARVARAVQGHGFDWADAGIGAGLAAALLLTAAGVSTGSVATRPRRSPS